MKNKKAELASIVILTAIFVAGFSVLYFLDSTNQITGAAVAGAPAGAIAGAPPDTSQPLFEVFSLFYNSSSNDQAWDVAVDSSDNIILTGDSQGGFLTIKYNENGTFLWNAAYMGFSSQAYSVAADSSNNVIVTGEDGVNADWYTIKYNENGTGLWNQTFTQNSTSTERPYGIAADSSNNVIVAGYAHNGINSDALVFKYHANGTSLFNATFDEGQFEQANDVAVDSADNIIIAGWDNWNNTVNQTYNVLVVKYNSNLTHLWNLSYELGASESAQAVAVDSSDNIIIAGYNCTTGGLNCDWLIVKFDQNGNELWNQTFDRGGSLDVRAYGVAVDSADNVIVTGFNRNQTGGAYTDYFTVLYDENGTQIQNISYDSGYGDVPESVAVDSKDDLIVFGDVSASVRYWYAVKYRYNTPPNVTQPVFSPNPVYTNNNLTANSTYFDFDLHNGTVFFNWTVNNNPVRFVNYSGIISNNPVTDTLDSSNFSKNQNITVYVWAFDNLSYSSVQSNTITISNSPPAAPAISLTPSSPTTVQNLYCNVTLNSTDIDNDSVNYTYFWFNNSNLVRTFGPTSQLSDTLGSGNTTKNENWNCTVIPFDGQNNGTNISAAVTIQNTPPTAVNLTSPANGSTVGPTPTFNWTNSTDMDNEPLTYFLEIAGSASFLSLLLNQSASNNYYSLNSSQNLSSGTYYWRVSACDSDTCVYSSENRTFIVDATPPSSTITSLTNNSDLGQNSFPVNISGTASDNVNVSFVQVYINGTYFNATGNNTWNYSWTPASDGEYQIYSRATDTFGNQETQFESYYIEIYTTSNLTNTTKINSIDLYSNLYHSTETDCTINNSFVNRSTLLNTTSQNCDIINTNLNHSECYNSIIKDCTGTGWYVDPSNITNVTGNNNNFTDANVSDSYVDNSNVSNSEVRSSNITSSSIVNHSTVTNSNLTNSQVDYSNISDSEVDDSEVTNSNINQSTVTDSNITDSQIQNSTLTNTNATDSTVTDSTATDSTINNSDIDDSTVTDSTINDANVTGSTITGSTLNNVTVIGSTITNSVLNNTNITNNVCYSGTLVYQGTTYTCSVSNPITLSSIYSPPSAPGGGGGGGRIPYECDDNIDNDNDGLIDYPADPGCLAIYDDEEDEVSCQQGWICSQWGECQNNTQTRDCYDVNQCQEKLAAGQVERVINITKPTEERACALPPAPSCRDNIQNQGEEGIDCGGPCPPCPAPPECLSTADCPENNDCLNNTCVPIPEREPSAFIQAVTGFFKSAYRGITSAFSFIFDWSREAFAQLWQLNKTLNQKFISLAKAAFSKAIDLTRENYSSIIIFVLTIALIIAGIFAYQSFIHSAGYEKAKRKQKQIQKKKEKQQLHQASQQLTNYVRDALFAGSRPAQVKKSLISVGWPEKIANKYTDRIYEIYKKDLRSARRLSKLKSEDLALEKSIKKPQSGIAFFQKPEITKTKIQTKEEPHHELFDRITKLIQQDRSEEKITNILIQEKWPPEFVRNYLHTHFPQLKKITLFKKEVKDLEETLKKLKKR